EQDKNVPGHRPGSPAWSSPGQPIGGAQHRSPGRSQQYGQARCHPNYSPASHPHLDWLAATRCSSLPVLKVQVGTSSAVASGAGALARFASIDSELPVPPIRNFCCSNSTTATNRRSPSAKVSRKHNCRGSRDRQACFFLSNQRAMLGKPTCRMLISALLDRCVLIAGSCQLRQSHCQMVLDHFELAVTNQHSV